jgi:hypothetical protein
MIGWQAWLFWPVAAGSTTRPQPPPAAAYCAYFLNEAALSAWLHPVVALDKCWIYANFLRLVSFRG